MPDYKTVNQIANDIIGGKMKLSDVPEFRRKSVSNLMKLAKPDTIAVMAAKDENKSLEPKSTRKEPTKFFGSKLRNVRSW